MPLRSVTDTSGVKLIQVAKIKSKMFLYNRNRTEPSVSAIWDQFVAHTQNYTGFDWFFENFRHVEIFIRFNTSLSRCLLIYIGTTPYNNSEKNKVKLYFSR